MYKIFDILCCSLLSYYMESYYSDIENDYIIVMDM